MSPKKKSRKKRPSPSAASDREAALVASLLADSDTGDPVEIAGRLPDAHAAMIFVERLPTGHGSAVPLLRAVHDRFPDKNVRKAIRRALFKLERKGIQVPSFSGDDAESRGVLKPAASDAHAAHVGPPDAEGYRSVMVVKAGRTRGVTVGIGFVSDGGGMRHFASSTLTRKDARGMRDQLSRKAGPLVETSLSHAATVLEAAYRRHLALDLDPPAEYLGFRTWLLENSRLLDRSPVHDLLPPESRPEGGLPDARLKTFLQHNLLASWVISPERLQPFIEAVRHAGDSPIFLTEAQKADRLREIRGKALRDLFPSSERAALKGRFEEMAYFFFKLGDPERAGMALAAGRMVVEDTGPDLNPVIAFLLERSLRLYTGRTAGTEAAGPTVPGPGTSSRIIIP